MNKPLTYPNCCFNHFAEAMDPLQLNCAKTARTAKIESTLDECENENALLNFGELSNLYNNPASTLQRLVTTKNCAKDFINFIFRTAYIFLYRSILKGKKIITKFNLKLDAQKLSVKHVDVNDLLSDTK